MAGSGVRNFWAMSIIRDVPYVEMSSPPPPPPQQQVRPPRAVKNVDDQFTISLPVFAGRYNPSIYLEWEFDVEEIFISHNFPEHKRLKAATGKFVDFASIWWTEHCHTNAENMPKTWSELKIIMRGRFVPKYYINDLLRKLQCLKQGSNTVEEYYNDLQLTLFHCGLEESEDVIMDIFWDGLNHDI